MKYPNMMSKTGEKITLNVTLTGNSGKIIKTAAALLDTSARDLIEQATISYLMDLATTTDDQLLLSVIKGQVASASKECTCADKPAESDASYSECEKCGGTF